METNPRSTTNRFAKSHSTRWASGATAMLLCLSFILSACGDGAAPAGAPAAEPTTAAPAAPAATEAVETPESDDT
jgi:hypothetical protein